VLGTVKSVTVRQAVTQLKEMSQYIEINAMKLADPSKIYQEFYQSLSVKRAPGVICKKG